MPDKTTLHSKANPDINQIDWSRTTYLAHLASLIDSNMTYLHSTLTWAVTVLLGTLGFVTARNSFPDQVTYVSLLILMLILGHFAVRTGKAYLNVMRFGTLEKHLISSYLNEKSENWAEIKSLILQYHCDWSSPLSFRYVVYKLLFELGFIYFFGIVVGLVFYTLFIIDFQWYLIWELIITLLLLVIEILLGLLRSSYFRNIKQDKIAQKQR